MRHTPITRSVAAVALAVGMASTACVPKIANVARGDTVPEVIATLVPRESEILVLPLWLDSRQFNFRDPYVIPASAIGTSEAVVPSRIRFYLDDFVCGGSPVFVVGYLVVSESGTAIWSDVRGENTFTNRAVVKRELNSLLLEEELGPHLRELMEYGTADVGFRADRGDLRTALNYLERIPDEQ